MTRPFPSLTLYLPAAWQAWSAKHNPDPCDCDVTAGYACGLHHYFAEEEAARRDKTITRLARWLAWRERRTSP